MKNSGLSDGIVQMKTESQFFQSFQNSKGQKID